MSVKPKKVLEWKYFIFLQLQNDGLERSMITETPAKFRFINRPYRVLFIFLWHISVHVICIGSEI